MRELNSDPFKLFPKLDSLDVSLCSLESINEEGMKHLSNIRRLDLSGNSLNTFPREVFRGLGRLEGLKADNYKLCCGENLPLHFDVSRCEAPKDDVSSCEDLLRIDAYRACLWLFAALSLSGNTAGFLVRLLTDVAVSRSGFHVFVTNLSMADFLMGVYLAMVGRADWQYRGDYVRNERGWRRSASCQAAGFLSLLSNEMSAFIICLITLDRFLVLRFPFSRFHFSRRSALVACGVAWGVGLAMAATPLLPSFLHWQFYSQTGICIPLPITRVNFPGRDYSFGIMIVFNFALFVLVAVGQASIFWSIRLNTMTMDSSSKSRDVTIARRLITVAVSDFLCWFPIGLLGMLAFQGTPIPGEVNVAMAIFVLPLNSAINPFLYTFNTLMEKRRKLSESRLLKWLELNMVQQRKASDQMASSEHVETGGMFF